MKIIIAFITTLTVGFLPPCFCVSDQEQRLASVNNDIALRLLKVFRSDGNDNVFFSPYSLSAALGMTYAGARGTTKEEMSHVLGYTQAGLSDADVQEAFANRNNHLQAEAVRVGLREANSAAIQEGLEILGTYYGALNRSFNAHLLKLNFANNSQQAVDTINAWAKQATRDQVPKVFVEPLDAETKIVLVNLFIFYGKWASQFSPEETYKRTFYNGGMERTLVDMMFHRLKTNYLFDESLQATVVELLYCGDYFSMVIFLPSERTGVEALKQNLTIAKLDMLTASFRNTTIELYLPKFDLEKEHNLKSDLMNLGLHEIFGNGDLSGMTGDAQLFVSDVVQRAVVKVYEGGAEAAAAPDATDATLMSGALPVVNVDHPFLFFIRNRITGEIILAGQVNNF